MNTSVKRTTFSLATVVVFLCCLFTLSTPALAKDYELTQTDIVANVNADASMDVSQTRTFEFDGSFTLMMIPLGSATNFTVTSAVLSIDGQDSTLEEVPFQTSWRTSGGAGRECYSLDTTDGTVYVFTTSSASTQTVKLNYTYPQALKVHDDVSELYWKFVSDAWEKSSNNVTCTVNLPVPSGTTPSSEDIRAWAHGQLNGHVQNNADGVVKLNVDKVRGGDYAETRITFPSSWMNSSVKNTAAYVQGSALDSILAEEQQLADESNAKRSQTMFLIGLLIVIPILFIILTIVLFFKFGKEYKPQFAGEYWRDVPDPDFHPAVIARNERWDKNSTSDISATIMHLHVNGFITVEAASREKKGIFRTKNVDDIIISEVPNIAPPADPIDAATMKFLFENVESTVETSTSNARQIYISDISNMAEGNPEDAKFALDRWQAVLDGEVLKKNLFETTGTRIAAAYKGITALLVVLAFLGLFVGGVFLDLSGDILAFFLIGVGVMFVTAIVFAIFSKTMNRRTHHANEVHAKTKALKKWLCEFTTLDERPALDMKVWGEFMVYATILDVADKAIKQMQIAEPAMFDDDYFVSTGYLPWWFWCNHTMYSDGIGSLNGGFDALEDAFSDVGSALDSAFSGDWSSGSGFGGGGFSIGGGGGFGGGGFGGAR